MAEAQTYARKHKRHRIRLFKVGAAKAALKEFDKGSEITCYTFGQFSVIDVMVAIMQKTGPAHVVIATWTAAAADLRRSRELMSDSRILSCRWIVDRSFKNRQPEYLEKMVELFGDDSIRSLETHAKFMLIYNEDWNVVIRTSMNLNENKRLENLDVVEDYDFCRWHRDLVDGVFRDREAGDHGTRAFLDLSGVTPTEPEYQCEVGVASIGHVYEKGEASCGPFRPA
ncbi:hypothetical protein ACUY29_11285 [Corynebacterium aurimucosum]